MRKRELKRQLAEARHRQGYSWEAVLHCCAKAAALALKPIPPECTVLCGPFHGPDGYWTLHIEPGNADRPVWWTTPDGRVYGGW